MRKTLVVLLLLFVAVLSLQAAYFKNQQTIIHQPDGTVIPCLSSGDEFFNWLHDSNGYTIIQSQADGFFYYATRSDGNLVPSSYRVNEVNPASVGLVPWLKISKEAYLAKRNLFNQQIERDSKAPTSGTINNVVVFIRFSDQSEFTDSRNVFNLKFNDNTANAISMYDYYQEVSYNTLSVLSTYYPSCDMTTNLSFVDSHPRAYYQPYNATTNPTGYQNSTQSRDRESTLLKNAILAIASQVPTTLNIDGDNNGKVDNVCFIIRGPSDTWNDLLWAHRTWLTTQTVYINNKRVYDYTFQPENQNDTSTLCHEMFHSMGAPDLYNYNTGGGSANGPCSNWDIMDGDFVHPMTYMKYRYGHWITNIPTLTQSGTYYLRPLGSANHTAYKIPSPASTTQFFIVEYRKEIPGTYEMNLPSSGITITRVNTAVDGLGNTNGPPDELYVYRVDGTTTTEGSASSATFSIDTGRTEFNDTTNPSCFLANGAAGGIFIHNAGACGDSISFTLNPELGTLPGHITANPALTDYTPVTVHIFDQTFNPDNSGNFMLDIYQGFYRLTASLDGYADAVYNNVEVVPFVLSPTIQVQLNELTKPQNLTYYIEQDSVHLSWDFNFANAPQFTNFVIYISLNGTTFSGGRTTTVPNYTMHLSPNHNYWFYIKAVHQNGISFASNTILANTSPVVDPSVEPVIAPELYQNYPNPFTPDTRIRFQAPKGERNPRIEIFNLKGQLIRSLDAGNASEVHWNGIDKDNNTVSSGMYLYRLCTDSQKSEFKKMVLIK